MFTLSERSVPIPLVDIPAPAGQVLGAAFDRALETNPVPMFMVDREIQRVNAIGPKLTPEEVASEAARNGVTVTAPKEGMSPQALAILIQRRKDDIAFQVSQQRSPGGFMVGAGQLATGFAGSLMDPINVAAGMIPVLGGTKYAAALAGAASATSRAGLRLGVGAAEGLVGATLVEAPTLALHRDLQDDYTLGDSLANIAFGTFASAGIRGAGGALRDLHLGLDRARQQDALRAIEPEVWAQVRREAANAQERAFWSDLEAGFQRGEGIPEPMQAHFARERYYMESQRAASEWHSTMGDFQNERAADAQQRTDAANQLEQAMNFRGSPAAQRILQLADEAIARRMENERQKNLAAGMEPDDALRAAFVKVHPETEKALKSQAEIGAERLNAQALDAARARIAEGKGLVFIPQNAAQIQAAINGETHAAALRASVAQAVSGRPVDPTPVVKSDPVYGAQRITTQEMKLLADSSMAPENKVSADPAASRRATTQIAEAPRPAKTGAKGAAAGGETPQAAPKSPEVAELETLMSAAESRLRAEGVDGEALAAAKAALDEQMKSSTDYEKAWAAVADCVQGRG